MDSKHAFKEIEEEETRELCPSLKDSNSESEDEGEEAVLVEDLEGKRDGWNKIEFPHVTDLIELANDIMRKPINAF